MLRSQEIGKDRVVGRRVGRAMVLVLVTALVAIGYATEAYAAPGDLDTSFGSGGKVTTDYADVNALATALVVQDDDKIVVAGGTFQFFGPTHDFNLTRYNPNGTLDTTFSGDGKVTTNIGVVETVDEGQSVAIGADGKIVVAGSTSSDSNPNDFAVARYNPNGTLDTTFSGDGKVTTPIGSGADAAYGVALQGTKTVVVGYSDQGATSRDFAVVRYDASGNLDTTFSGDGKLTTDFSGLSNGARSVALQPDGKIVAAGYAWNGSNYDFAIARYDSSGNLDTSFSSDGKTTTDFGSSSEEAYGAALQEDGKIVVGGYSDIAGSNDFALARYNPNGSLDGEFDFDGRATTDFGGNRDVARSVVIQDNGRIVAAGFSGVEFGDNDDFALARYNADGTPNNTFSNDSRVKTDFGGSDGAYGVGLQTDGNIVAAGFTNHLNGSFNIAAARYYGGTDDVTPPKVSRPSHTLLSPTTVGTTDVPIRLSWSATDAQGDVTRYQLQRSTNGGAYANVSLAAPTTTIIDQFLTPAHNYRYRVRATDDAGNTSLYKYGPRFTMDAHQETSTAIAYSATTAWTQEALSGSYGGQVKFATVAGSTATLTFTGTNVAWVAPKSPERGQAEVFLDNVKVATVDLTSTSALTRQVVYAANGLSPSVTHKLQVKVLGTANRPRVDVDAFVVVR